MANQKLLQEELQQIEDIQKRMQAIKTELGQLGLAKIDLRNRKINVENYLADTQEMESKLVKGLEEKYGKGSIDLQKGEFIPSAETTDKVVIPTVE
jgi:phosphopantetheine adenylyltransferase